MHRRMYERTYDAEYIYNTVTSPKIWRMSANDFSPPKELYFVPLQNDIVWLKAGDYGLFMFAKQDDDAYQSHVALNAFALGVASDIAIGAVIWMFSHTGCKTLIAKIPEFNHLAHSLARKVGFELCGIDRESFVKDGIKHDTRIYILNRSDICLF